MSLLCVQILFNCSLYFMMNFFRADFWDALYAGYVSHKTMLTLMKYRYWLRMRKPRLSSHVLVLLDERETVGDPHPIARWGTSCIKNSKMLGRDILPSTGKSSKASTEKLQSSQTIFPLDDVEVPGTGITCKSYIRSRHRILSVVFVLFCSFYFGWYEKTMLVSRGDRYKKKPSVGRSTSFLYNKHI